MAYKMSYHILKYILFVVFYFYDIALGSTGDTSNEFMGCYHLCHFNNCSTDKSLNKFYKTQDIFESILQWSCDDECKYNCMWHATDIFTKKDLNIPQFYGKWPFMRLCGIQEPASAIFSLLNFIAVLFHYQKFKQTVPQNAPLYYIWTINYWVCLNAWLWSLAFHTRDNSFTEKMDYFCAFSMVLYSLFILLIRVSGKTNTRRKLTFGILLLLLFIYHVWYLSTKAFDYGYNMKVNVSVGIINGFGWLLWSWSRSDEREYLFWCRVTVIAAVASIFLEVLDFAPIFWLFDAHALWHLSTSVLPFYWYQFMVGDCLYLLQGKSSYKKSV